MHPQAVSAAASTRAASSNGFLRRAGQEEDWDAVQAKSKLLGASKMVILDLRREFVEELCFRAVHLLGTSLARPVIARAQMKVAKQEGCQYVSHGCTGKGNDQVRFELAFLTIDPTIKIIAPWRMPEFFNRFQGRLDLLDYASSTGIPVTSTKAKPYSMDDNLAHCSYESGQLEDPSQPPPTDMWTRTDDPEKAPNTPQDIQIVFAKGLPVKLSVDGKDYTDSVELFLKANEIGKIHGIGRIDIVENRFIGLKSRGCYDSPGMTILRLAHLDLEGLVMDGKVRSLRDQFVTHNWSELLYNGMYFSPEREFVENSLLFSQKHVNGEVRLRCYKGNAYVLGRSSDAKLYSLEESSMDTLVDFSPVDTSGFININAIRLKKYGLQKAEDGEDLALS
ncbi:argininosuccinate synthase [Niveomyces insectorum RCEF 264]|uniref:Argininosuccinate synthase n=1 Tax=Niveomyces insectorum RCEF 264 TaxID=1081102 RepID=A0A167Y526_9HYPO|nr:argininosuccinate synthase [Niveomyces insectorum RCEF 264]